MLVIAGVLPFYAGINRSDFCRSNVKMMPERECLFDKCFNILISILVMGWAFLFVMVHLTWFQRSPLPRFFRSFLVFFPASFRMTWVKAALSKCFAIKRTLHDSFHHVSQYCKSDFKSPTKKTCFHYFTHEIIMTAWLRIHFLSMSSNLSLSAQKYICTSE